MFASAAGVWNPEPVDCMEAEPLPPSETNDPLGHVAPEWLAGFEWVEQQVGGRVVRAERQPRWRPAWFIDIERDGRVVPLYFRGERGETDHVVYAL